MSIKDIIAKNMSYAAPVIVSKILECIEYENLKLLNLNVNKFEFLHIFSRKIILI